MNCNCHNCKYDGQGNDACLSCQIKNRYAYPYGMRKNEVYLLDDFDEFMSKDAAERDEPLRSNCLTEELEEKFLAGLFKIFDLSPLELLCLQAIMQGKKLTEWANQMTQFFQQNDKEMTRQHAYELRRSILNKLGEEFANALRTNGQRKTLRK